MLRALAVLHRVRGAIEAPGPTGARLKGRGKVSCWEPEVAIGGCEVRGPAQGVGGWLLTCV